MPPPRPLTPRTPALAVPRAPAQGRARLPAFPHAAHLHRRGDLRDPAPRPDARARRVRVPHAPAHGLGRRVRARLRRVRRGEQQELPHRAAAPPRGRRRGPDEVRPAALLVGEPRVQRGRSGGAARRGGHRAGACIQSSDALGRAVGARRHECMRPMLIYDRFTDKVRRLGLSTCSLFGTSLAGCVM